MKAINFEMLPTAVAELKQDVSDLKEMISNLRISKPIEKEEFLNIEEAAEFLNLSVPTIYSKVSRREIPHIKRGKRLYFSSKELTEFLKSGRVKTIDELEADADAYLTSKKKGLNNGK